MHLFLLYFYNRPIIGILSALLAKKMEVLSTLHLRKLARNAFI